MHRYFIAAVVTLTVLITGFSAAPARANNTDDLAKVLAGIAALAIVGKVIHDRRDKKKKQVIHTPQVHKPHQNHIYRQQTIIPKPLPKRVARKSLPAHCVRHVQMYNGNTRRVFGARCLNRNYRHAQSLPNHCARQIQTHRGARWVYGARCLRNNGYQIARY